MTTHRLNYLPCRLPSSRQGQGSVPTTNCSARMPCALATMNLTPEMSRLPCPAPALQGIEQQRMGMRSNREAQLLPAPPGISNLALREQLRNLRASPRAVQKGPPQAESLGRETPRGRLAVQLRLPRKPRSGAPRLEVRSTEQLFRLASTVSQLISKPSAMAGHNSPALDPYAEPRRSHPPAKSLAASSPQGALSRPAAPGLEGQLYCLHEGALRHVAQNSSGGTGGNAGPPMLPQSSKAARR
mmetsp:Transcript_65799/g.143377  ORF Transcript_65799/g.143377 Transcript_65799/m.143377 type:complete len:243 (+) Transcript_65799:71-799(+)